jgi:hypothetical protein
MKEFVIKLVIAGGLSKVEPHTILTVEISDLE